MRLRQSENCTPYLYFLPPISVTSCQILTDFPALCIPHSWNQVHHPRLAVPLPFSWEEWAASCPWDCTLGHPLSQGSLVMAPRPPPSGCSPTAGCPQQGTLHLGLECLLRVSSLLSQFGSSPIGGIPRGIWGFIPRTQCHPKGPC